MSIRYLFPDNTVFCNFAAVRRLDLLETVLNGRGRWTEAVAAEAAASANHLPALRGLEQAGRMGEPLAVTDDADVLAVNRIRRLVFGGTDDKPRQHLGEAETCHVLKHWAEFAGSWWITDDQEALRYARRQGIVSYETIDLMAKGVNDGDIGEGEAFSLMEQMVASGRSLRQPATPSVFRR